MRFPTTTELNNYTIHTFGKKQKRQALSLRQANPDFFDMENKLDMSTIYYSEELDSSLSLLPDLLGKDVFFEGRGFGRGYNLGDYTSIWARMVKGALNGKSPSVDVMPFRITMDRDDEGCFIVEFDDFKREVDTFAADDSKTLLLVIVSIEPRALHNADGTGGHVNGITIRKIGPTKSRVLGLQYFEPHVQVKNLVSGAENKNDIFMYGDCQACMETACGDLGIEIFSNAFQSIDDATGTVIANRAFLPLTKKEEGKYTKLVRGKDREPRWWFPEFGRFTKLQSADQLCQTWVTWYLVLRGMNFEHDTAVKYMMYHRFSGLLSFIRFMMNCRPDWTEPRELKKQCDNARHDLPLCDLLLTTGQILTTTNPYRISKLGGMSHIIPIPYTAAPEYRKTEDEINAGGRLKWNLEDVDFEMNEMGELNGFCCDFYYSRWAPLALETADKTRQRSDFGSINPSLDIYTEPYNPSGGDDM